MVYRMAKPFEKGMTFIHTRKGNNEVVTGTTTVVFGAKIQLYEKP